MKSISESGTIFYKNSNGEYHRIDGPAIEYANGHNAWYLNGNRHREDGPAVEYTDGGKAWYINDKLHREDGPAVEYSTGYKAWFLNNKEYTEEEYKQEVFKIRLERFKNL